MTTTRAVLFDLGGTLTRAENMVETIQLTLQRLAGLSESDADCERAARAMKTAQTAVARAFFARPFYLHRDLFQALAGAALGELGVVFSPELLARFEDGMSADGFANLTLRDGVCETLTALRRRGLYLGVVSNADESHMWPIVERCGLEPYVDLLLSSEAARSCKPDPGIFGQALRRAGCAAEEALFVGDMPAFDIAGAKRAGMRAALILDGFDLAVPDAGVRPDHVIHAIPEVLGLVA